jgi:tRNA-uridine 2-sulfurtransferase
MVNFIPNPKKRVVVAMSGGVDSSVAAYLMAKAGHDVVGLTAWTLNGPGKCCNDALVNAGRVCEMLGVPYDTVDLRAAFSHYVMDYYNNSYQKGLTPNPCVECNRYVKWELLVDYAVQSLGADYVATGHYAILEHLEPQAGQQKQDSIRVLRSVDEHKDQTYMMARVYPKDLAKTIFPLGAMKKTAVVRTVKNLRISALC